MVSAQAQRTLVKSPPELWAELSDPAALARHLGELGEIRITRLQPEQKIERRITGQNSVVLNSPNLDFGREARETTGRGFQGRSTLRRTFLDLTELAPGRLCFRRGFNQRNWRRRCRGRWGWRG